MDKYSLLRAAKEQGYIIGSSSVIESINKEYYEWCRAEDRPYIEITKKSSSSSCHFSMDTPSGRWKLNKNGIDSVRHVMQHIINTEGFYSIGSDQMFHENVPVQASVELANEIIRIVKDKNNIEAKI